MVPYPVLVLRNSFLLLTNAQEEKVTEAGWSVQDLFKPDLDLMNDYVKKHSDKKLNLEIEIKTIKDFYSGLRFEAEQVDITLGQHIAALEHKTVKQLKNLEKKLVSAEKRAFEAQHRQLIKLKEELFPKNSLQERVENIIPFYAMYGKEIISCIYQNSPAFKQQFGIINLG